MKRGICGSATHPIAAVNPSASALKISALPHHAGKFFSFFLRNIQDQARQEVAAARLTHIPTSPHPHIPHQRTAAAQHSARQGCTEIEPPSHQTKSLPEIE
ncbi:MAG: hypothetical protein B7Z37_26010 [Verrucomicrobia bacterium 12-59-8]|nr:MAG: hypothetical protein B7Z37_26010 [Verrucomicrobia bacterium 12-59-8]